MRLVTPALTAVLVLVSIGVFTNWLAVRPLPVLDEWRTLPVLVGLAFRLGLLATPLVTQALLGLIAGIGIAACLLAAVLTLKIPHNIAARRLAASLAWTSLSVAYFFFLWPYPELRRMLVGDAPGAWVSFAADLGGYLALAAGLWHLGRFFEIYPRPIAPEDWSAFERETRVKSEASFRHGWRRRIYLPSWLSRPRTDVENRFEHWLGPRPGPRTTAMLFGGAVLLAVWEVTSRTFSWRLGAGNLHLGIASTLVFGAGTAMLMLPFAGNFHLVQFHHARGLPDDRLRVEWIYSTLMAAYMLALVVVLLGMALFFAIVIGAGEASVGYSANLYFYIPSAFAVPFFALAFLLSVALSIFYRGAVDPRLAARKVTVWWLLGAAVAILFVIIERAVAVRIVQWLGMPSDMGYILAGALVAGTVAPIRKHSEATITAFVGRVLPIEQLMDGERRSAVVAMCDLSGYTALSVKDEKQALLLAALLHRKAAVISQAHGGRMVKSIGDAVMLEFPDADRAARALNRLHAEFPVACRTMGFEPLPVHSGAHLGEVVVGHDGDLFGQTVNLAARLQGEAKSGQIVVSQAFIAGCSGDSAGGHRALGPRHLKNIPDAVDCHELLAEA